MNHFSLNNNNPPPSSHTLWCTPTPMDSQLHHPPKPFPFSHHPSSQTDDVESDTTTTSTTKPPPETPPSPSPSPSSADYEYLFEKPLTPSDVGKLNRLVIPKQYAEKYFPLEAKGNNGILLGFEDELGKSWKFRYSYWNSSQSYVLTKGWSRYVKEKRLDAGDVVFFQRRRRVDESDRFFIGWRRGGSTSVFSYQRQSNPVQFHQHWISSHAEMEIKEENGEKGIKSGGGNSKRVRLFGVNLECHVEEEEKTEGEEVVTEEIEMSQIISGGLSLSSQGQASHAGSGSSVGPTAYNYVDYMGYPNHH